MTPIHELLSRMRWDKGFGQGRFEIGYFDRHEGTIHRKNDSRTTRLCAKHACVNCHCETTTGKES